MAPLTLLRAAAVRPATCTGLTQWRAQARQAWDAAEPSPYRGLTELMFSQTACRPGPEAENGLDMPQRFRDAGPQTQCQLASAALQAVLQQQDVEATRRCKLAVYGTASVDEHFFESTISRLASGHGFSSLPHFGLAQLQGATLPAAAEIIDAMLPGEGDAALFISADKWPLPFPRECGDAAVLGDGAAALWFARGHHVGLQYVGGCQASCAPFVSGGWRGAATPARIDCQALVGAAAAAITLCLSEHGLQPADLDGWMAAGLHPTLERSLRERLGVQDLTLIEPDPEDGYLGAAAMPVLLAEALHRSAAAEFADGALLLGWGVSFGGGVGVALWRVVCPKEH